jgi:hypothetical protein
VNAGLDNDSDLAGLLAALSGDKAAFSSAYRRLWALRDTRALPGLIGIYRRSEHTQRKWIGQLIGRSMCPRAWCELFGLFGASDVDEHREWAARIAQEFGDGGAEEALLVLEHDANGHVRTAATRALQAIRGRAGHGTYGDRDPEAVVWVYELGR